MDETMKNTTTEEINENTTVENEIENAEEALKKVFEEQLKKTQRQNLLIGGQAACRVVLDKIIAFKAKPGKPTMNDYKRLAKDIETFCSIGLSRKVTADGETVPIEETAEETVQN